MRQVSNLVDDTCPDLAFVCWIDEMDQKCNKNESFLIEKAIFKELGPNATSCILMGSFLPKKPYYYHSHAISFHEPNAFLMS